MSKFTVIAMTAICEPMAPPTCTTSPRAALFTLATATMTMVTGEMLPTAVLGPMSAGLGVPEARIGLLVGAWAGTVVLVSFPLVRLTHRFDRRQVIGWSLWVSVASALATALADGFWTALGARTVGAGAVGLLWATVNAHVAALVDDTALARANALVLGGATAGVVIGTPTARLVAEQAGWRAAFAGLALATAGVAYAVRRLVPGGAASAGAPAGSTGAATRRPMFAVTGLVALALAGHYGVYTFVTRLTERTAERVPGGTSGVLLVFGLASAGGVAAAGRAVRLERALVAALAGTGVATLGLLVAAHQPVAGLAVVAAWGLASGALPPLAQTTILRLAGAEHRVLAGALIPVMFNGGIALGAFGAAGLVGVAGLGPLPIAGAAMVGVATAGVATRRRVVA